MVNKDRIKAKIPELLVDSPLTNKTSLYEYQGLRRKLRVVERKNSNIVGRAVHKIKSALEELEDALEHYDITIE